MSTAPQSRSSSGFGLPIHTSFLLSLHTEKSILILDRFQISNKKIQSFLKYFVVTHHDRKSFCQGFNLVRAGMGMYVSGCICVCVYVRVCASAWAHACVCVFVIERVQACVELSTYLTVFIFTYLFCISVLYIFTFPLAFAIYPPWQLRAPSRTVFTR